MDSRRNPYGEHGIISNIPPRSFKEGKLQALLRARGRPRQKIAAAEPVPWTISALYGLLVGSAEARGYSTPNPTSGTPVGATLDGIVEGAGAGFQAKFMLPWWFSEESVAAKYMPLLQHNLWIKTATTEATSVGKALRNGGQVPGQTRTVWLWRPGQDAHDFAAAARGQPPQWACEHRPQKPRLESSDTAAMRSSTASRQRPGSGRRKSRGVSRLPESVCGCVLCRERRPNTSVVV
jgi:hypothetical protein